MDQLAEMRVFVRAIERGTFAGAAGDLGLTPSAVSKLIARLEARLGVRLVNRTTRKLSLTSEGETYFHSGQRLVEAMDGLEHEVAASAGRPRGLLRINTAVSFGVQHLAPALIEFQERYPDVRVSMSLTDRPVDMHAEQIDVAVRIGPLDDSSLMSRKITEIERVICASPQYVERFGAPQTPRGVGAPSLHRLLVFGTHPLAIQDGRRGSGAAADNGDLCQRQPGVHPAMGVAGRRRCQASRFHGRSADPLANVGSPARRGASSRENTGVRRIPARHAEDPEGPRVSRFHGRALRSRAVTPRRSLRARRASWPTSAQAGPSTG